MEMLVQNILNGVTIGAFYALVALGYTMVYGVLKLINFAHGDLFMWGAYLGYTGFTLLLGLGLRGGPWMIVPVILGAMFVVALGGILLERTAYRPLRHAGRLPPIISALGAAFVLESLARNIYGASYITYPTNITPTGGITLIGDVTVSTMQIILLVSAFALMGILWLFVNYTRVGTAMRAVSLDHDTSRLMGIDVNRIITVVFLIGPALGAAAGIMVALVLRLVRFHAGLDLRPEGVHRGDPRRHRQHPGRHAGRAAPGHRRKPWAPATCRPQWKDVIAYVLLVLILIVRPTGLLGERVAEKL